MTEPLSQQQLVAVLRAALSHFRNELDPEITASRILTYLAVVDSPGIQQADIPQILNGVSSSGASRNILDLTSTTSARKPGPNLIVQQSDPMYRKRHLLYLTPTGQQWAADLTAHVANVTKGLFRG